MTSAARLGPDDVPEIWGSPDNRTSVIYLYGKDGRRHVETIAHGVHDAQNANKNATGVTVLYKALHALWVEYKAYRHYLRFDVEGWHIEHKSTFSLQHVRTFPTFEAADMFVQHLISSE